MSKKNDNKNLDLINFIKSIYHHNFIPLHEPRFIGNEKTCSTLTKISNTFKLNSIKKTLLDTILHDWMNPYSNHLLYYQ